MAKRDFLGEVEALLRLAKSSTDTTEQAIALVQALGTLKEYRSENRKPTCAASIVVFDRSSFVPVILCFKRVKAPAAGAWCNPCGKIDMWETVEEAACRELKEETGIIRKPHQLHALPAFTTFFEDTKPRSHCITHQFWTQADRDEAQNLEPQSHSEMVWTRVAERVPTPFIEGGAEAIRIACVRRQAWIMGHRTAPEVY